MISRDLLQVSGERAVHLKEVLRVEVGRRVRVGALEGKIGEAEIVEMREGAVVLRLLNLDREPQPSGVDLILALPRPQTLKKVLELSAAMGVRRLMLVASKRVEKSYFHSSLLQRDRMEKHLRLGLEQSMSTRAPGVSIHTNLRRFLSAELPQLSPHNDEKRLVADPAAGATLLSIPWAATSYPLMLAVGPEGGWIDDEIKQFEQTGFAAFNAGPRVLRVENAVCCLLGQLELLRSMRKQIHE